MDPQLKPYIGGPEPSMTLMGTLCLVLFLWQSNLKLRWRRTKATKGNGAANGRAIQNKADHVVILGPEKLACFINCCVLMIRRVVVVVVVVVVTTTTSTTTTASSIHTTTRATTTQQYMYPYHVIEHQSQYGISNRNNK
jgi:hypothetical protein